MVCLSTPKTTESHSDAVESNPKTEGVDYGEVEKFVNENGKRTDIDEEEESR